MAPKHEDPWHYREYIKVLWSLVAVGPIFLLCLAITGPGFNFINFLLFPVWAVLGFWVAIIVHETGHLLSMKRHGIRAKLFRVPGFQFDFEFRQAVFFPKDLLGVGGAVTLLEAPQTVEDMKVWRKVAIAGNRANFWVGVLSVGVVGSLYLVPSLLVLAPAIGMIGSMCFLFCFMNGTALRVSSTLVSDMYWKRLIDRDPRVALMNLQAAFALKKFVSNAPEEYTDHELPDSHGNPFLSAVFRYYRAMGRDEIKEAGLILERALRLPIPSAPTTGQTALLANAAEYFVRHVDDRPRAKAYAKQVKRSMVNWAFELASYKIALAVQDGKTKQVEPLIKRLEQRIPPGAEWDWCRKGLSKRRERGQPMSKEELAEVCSGMLDQET